MRPVFFIRINEISIFQYYYKILSDDVICLFYKIEGRSERSVTKKADFSLQAPFCSGQLLGRQVPGILKDDLDLQLIVLYKEIALLNRNGRLS